LQFEAQIKVKKDCVSALRREKRGLVSQENDFRKQSSDNSFALRASYRVAQLLAKERKPFSDRECVRKCLQHMVEEICLEKETVFNATRLSHTTT
jgi:hypothetical protein